MCLLLYLYYISVILLDIRYISVHLFIISPLSFRAENNLDQSNLSRSNDLVKDHAALRPAEI
jgi:hypothetical protein